MKIVYPFIMLKSKWVRPQKTTKEIQNPVPSPASFHQLAGIKSDGTPIDFSQFKGRKVLLVNTASNCGFTPQYEQLQKLHEQFKDKLVLLGFPSNDFKEQEKGNDEEIRAFCKVNYGVTFPLMKKAAVKKGVEQSDVFRWLTDASLNGWNNKEPTWNFSKYLVDENGTLVACYPPQLSPLDKEITNRL